MSRKDSISRIFYNAELAISNGRFDPIIAPALAAFGFDDGRFQAGADLLAQARALHDAQISAYAAQVGATAALNQAWQAADRTYAQHRQLAKLALGKTGGHGATILLHERRTLPLNGWLVQAGVFYSNALGSPEILAALAQYNLTGDDLAAGETAVAHIQALEAAQERAKSIAQHATRRRDAALDALVAWLGELRTLARLALTGPNAQLLESLGFGVVA